MNPKKVYIVVSDKDEPGGIFKAYVQGESESFAETFVNVKAIDVPKDFLEGEADSSLMYPEENVDPDYFLDWIQRMEDPVKVEAEDLVPGNIINGIWVY